MTWIDFRSEGERRESNTNAGADASSPGPEHQRLREDLLRLIHPHTTAAEKPPFTIAELIVIAAVCWDQGRSTRSTILNGIVTNFPYYSRLAIDQYVLTQDRRTSWGIPPPGTVLPDFHKTFNQYDLPLIDRYEKRQDAAAGPRSHALHSGGFTDWTESIEVLPRSARIFLSRWLSPEERKGMFPFLKLPAELRNTIYEMLFTFPKEGISVVSRYSFDSTDVPMPRLYVVRRAEDTHEPADPPDDALDGWDSGNLELSPRDRNLDLLRVCQQIHGEAVGYFYGLNRFRCIDITSTLGLLGLSPNRLKYVRDLRLVFCEPSGYGDDEFARLASLFDRFSDVAGQIRRLEIEMLPRDRRGCWRSSRGTRERSAMKTYAQVPSFNALAKLCSLAETFDFVGERDGVEKWVKEEVAKIKGSTAVQERGIESSRGPKKRGSGAQRSKGATAAHERVYWNGRVPNKGGKKDGVGASRKTTTGEKLRKALARFAGGPRRWF